MSDPFVLAVLALLIGLVVAERVGRGVEVDRVRKSYERLLDGLTKGARAREKELEGRIRGLLDRIERRGAGGGAPPPAPPPRPEVEAPEEDLDGLERTVEVPVGGPMDGLSPQVQEMVDMARANGYSEEEIRGLLAGEVVAPRVDRG